MTSSIMFFNELYLRYNISGKEGDVRTFLLNLKKLNHQSTILIKSADPLSYLYRYSWSLSNSKLYKIIIN